MEQKFRAYCFTLNNWDDFEYEQIKNISGVRYLLIGKEVGENGTPHLQGYIYFENPRSFKATCNKLKRWHIEIARGTPEENYKYCTKDGNFEEIGTIPKQGARVDLEELAERIKNGVRVEEIAEETPMAIHQYGRSLNYFEDMALRKLKRLWMTTCEWIYGPTGVGKSHYAFTKYPDAYIWKYDGKWQDGYRGQDVVIINEFRGQIIYNELLQMIDKWPHYLNRRGREPVPFLAKHIVITSCKHPKDVYCNLDERLDQLYRRINIIHLEQKWSEGNTKTSDPGENGGHIQAPQAPHFK